jgi:Raf kinase inhibitor-like YbhB/YbcL family protein
MTQTRPSAATRPTAQPAVQKFRLSSAAFADGAPIPQRHTADGENVSPHLSWSEPPADTESFALLCDDPDSRSGSFVHWLAWDIEPSQRQLNEGVPASAESSGISQGENGFGQTGYGGPKPPPGSPHRYVFRLLALDTRLGLQNGAKRDDLERAVEGHVLAEARLTGMYGR